MIKKGIANLPLHGGKCPQWLFPRMKKLSGIISEVIINEYGQQQYLQRLSDPYFLQALGCVIGYDWHSSGLTTTTLGALKEAINQKNLGIKFCGGKGKTARKTPDDILKFTEEFNISSIKTEKLIQASKMSAKVDTVLVQDNYELYHHNLAFDEQGNWIVIQQGMNTKIKYARRYHWSSNNLIKFIEEPHTAVCCDMENNKTLDLTNKQNNEVQKASLDIVNEDIKKIEKYLDKKIISRQKTLDDFNENKAEILNMPAHHMIINMQKRNIEMLKQAHEFQPKSYEELIALKGIGAKTIRSLALISELMYGTEIIWKDPVKFSFALGGKDKIPYEIDTKQYDETIDILENALDNAKLDQKEKLLGIRRLAELYT